MCGHTCTPQAVIVSGELDRPPKCIYLSTTRLLNQYYCMSTTCLGFGAFTGSLSEWNPATRAPVVCSVCTISVKGLTLWTGKGAAVECTSFSEMGRV